MRLAHLWQVGRLTLQIGLPILVIALVWREIHTLDIHAVRRSLADSSAVLVAWGIVVAFLAVLVMGLYDAVAFPRGASGKLGFGGRWLLGSVFFGWTNFISMGPLGGPALRLLAYRHAGLSGPEIARGFVGHAIGSTSGLTAWLIALWIPGLGFWPRVAIALAGSLLISFGSGRIAVPILRRHQYGRELDGLPLLRLASVSFVDWGLTLVSFMLFARSTVIELDPIGSGRTVLTGQLAGIASMMPGGLGSADAVWLKGLGVLGAPHDGAIATILVFRAGFYFLPWIASLLVAYTYLAIRSSKARLWQRRVVAGAVAMNATLLLLSAATPAARPRLHIIERVVPLGAIEASHLLAALSAVMMLFLVRGLLRGYRSAFISTLAFLAASAIAHPLKGGDIEESASSLVLLALLIGVRGAFVRKGRAPIGVEVALAAGVGSLAFFLVAGLAAFERIPYRHELWVTFADRAEASRFLRASVLLAITTLVVGLRQAMRPPRLWVTPSLDDVDRAERFVRAHGRSADSLIVGGLDKGVWIWEPDAGGIGGIVLYQRRGDRVIVFKDPEIRAGADPADLIRAFFRFAEEMDVDVVFSTISGAWMGHLHEFGFHFLKINEEAIITLGSFTLQGGKNAAFRRTLREVEKAGFRFEVIEPPFDRDTVDRLRAVSDAWLAGKEVRELQFSACCFSAAYIQRNPVAVAIDGDGRIVAFANLLVTRAGGPATLDLMRYIPGTVDNLMEYLILRTIQWLNEHGCSTFSLGGAPLSDVGTWRRSRYAERLLHAYSKRAERFYNYQGLLRFKNKFHPDWQPRYLAYQQPWEWAPSLIACTRLVQARSKSDRRRIALARVAPFDEGVRPAPESDATDVDAKGINPA